MTELPLGRAVSLVNETDQSRHLRLGLDAIEPATGRLLDSAEQHYEGPGIAFEPGDVLFGKLRPYLAKVWLADRPGAAVGDFHVYRPARDVVDPTYLKWLLLSSRFLSQVSASVAGAKMPRTSWDFVRNVPVWIPGMEWQRTIADYLDRETAQIDTLIAEQERVIDLLGERRRAIADAIFARVDAVLPLKRSVADVTVGIVVTPSNWYVEVGVPALRGVNISPGKVSRNDLVYLSPEGDQLHAKSRLRAGDVVVVRTGQAGAAAVVPKQFDKANAIDLLIVRPGAGVDSTFLAAYLNAPSVRSTIENGSVGAIQGHFNVNALRELPFPVLSFDAQQDRAAEWLGATDRIDRTIGAAQNLVGLAQERRSALITAAVTGQIDVRDMAA